MLARATGWSEAHIWQMSYTKGLMYLHCHLLYQGCNTRWAVAAQEDIQDINRKFDTFLKR